MQQLELTYLHILETDSLKPPTMALCRLDRSKAAVRDRRRSEVLSDENISHYSTDWSLTKSDYTQTTSCDNKIGKSCHRIKKAELPSEGAEQLCTAISTFYIDQE